MQPSSIAAQQILGLILAPLLEDFLRLANEQDEEWANVLVSRVAGAVEEVAPEIWDLEISPLQTPSVFDCLIRSEDIMLKDICIDPRDRTQNLPCVPLLLKRDGISSLLPAIETRLRGGDQVLFCGRKEAHTHMDHVVNDHQGLQYTRTGIDRPTGTVWRWLTRDREA